MTPLPIPIGERRKVRGFGFHSLGVILDVVLVTRNLFFFALFNLS